MARLQGGGQTVKVNGVTTPVSSDSNDTVATKEYVDDQVSNVSVNNLNDVGDVSITSAADNQFLRFDGTNWVNETVNLGSDISAGDGINISASDQISVDSSVARVEDLGTTFRDIIADNANDSWSRTSLAVIPAGSFRVTSSEIDFGAASSGDYHIASDAFDEQLRGFVLEITYLNPNDANDENNGIGYYRVSSAVYNAESSFWRLTFDSFEDLGVASSGYINSALISSDVLAHAAAGAGYYFRWRPIGQATTFSGSISGLVPDAASGDQSAYLQGDGTWSTPTGTTYTAGTGLHLNSNEFSVDFGVAARHIPWEDGIIEFVNTGDTELLYTSRLNEPASYVSGDIYVSIVSGAGDPYEITFLKSDLDPSFIASGRVIAVVNGEQSGYYLITTIRTNPNSDDLIDVFVTSDTLNNSHDVLGDIRGLALSADVTDIGVRAWFGELQQFSTGRDGVVPGPTLSESGTFYSLRGDGSWVANIEDPSLADIATFPYGNLAEDNDAISSWTALADGSATPTTGQFLATAHSSTNSYRLQFLASDLDPIQVQTLSILRIVANGNTGYYRVVGGQFVGSTQYYIEIADTPITGVNEILQLLAVTLSSDAANVSLDGDHRESLVDLEDLRDVSTTAATDGQVLTWDNDNSQWAPADSAGGASELNDLSDVAIENSELEVGQIMQYTANTDNSMDWKNVDFILDSSAFGLDDSTLSSFADDGSNVTYSALASGAPSSANDVQITTLGSPAHAFRFRFRADDIDHNKLATSQYLHVTWTQNSNTRDGKLRIIGTTFDSTHFDVETAYLDLTGDSRTYDLEQNAISSDTSVTLRSDTRLLDITAGGGSSTLSGLSDVTISSPAANQVLTYNGSNWVNQSAQSGDATVDGSIPNFTSFILASIKDDGGSGTWTALSTNAITGDDQVIIAQLSGETGYTLTFDPTDLDLQNLATCEFISIDNGTNTGYYRVITSEPNVGNTAQIVTVSHDPITGTDVLPNLRQVFLSSDTTITIQGNVKEYDVYLENLADVPAAAANQILARNSANNAYEWISQTNSGEVDARVDRVVDVDQPSGYAGPNSGSGEVGGTNSLAIGDASWSAGDDSIAIGREAEATGVNSIAIGINSHTTFDPDAEDYANDATAIGPAAHATHNYSTALGYQAATDRTNEVRLGRVGDFVTIPSAEAGQESLNNQLVTKQYVDNQINTSTQVITADNANTLRFHTDVATSDSLQGTGYQTVIGVGSAANNYLDGVITTLHETQSGEHVYMGAFTTQPLTGDGTTSGIFGGTISDEWSEINDDDTPLTSEASNISDNTRLTTLTWKWEEQTGRVRLAEDYVLEPRMGYAVAPTDTEHLIADLPSYTVYAQIVKLPSGATAIHGVEGTVVLGTSNSHTVNISASHTAQRIQTAIENSSNDVFIRFDGDSHGGAPSLTIPASDTFVEMNEDDIIAVRYVVRFTTNFDIDTDDFGFWIYDPHNGRAAGTLRPRLATDYNTEDYRFVLSSTGDLTIEDASTDPATIRQIYDYADDAINVARIGDASITNAKLADDAVAVAELDTTGTLTRGHVLTLGEDSEQNSILTWAAIDVPDDSVNKAEINTTNTGTNNQVLTLGSNGTDLVWADTDTSNFIVFNEPSDAVNPTAGGTGAIAMGDGASAGGANALALGNGATVGNDNNGVAIGHDAMVNEAGGVAIGRNASVPATLQNSTAIGFGATVTNSNQVRFGDSNITRVDVGNSSYDGTISSQQLVNWGTLEDAGLDLDFDITQSYWDTELDGTTTDISWTYNQGGGTPASNEFNLTQLISTAPYVLVFLNSDIDPRVFQGAKYLRVNETGISIYKIYDVTENASTTAVTVSLDPLYSTVETDRLASIIASSSDVGAINLRVDNWVFGGGNIGDLNDVSSTAATDGQYLIWNATNSQWEPTTASNDHTFTTDDSLVFSDNELQVQLNSAGGIQLNTTDGEEGLELLLPSSGGLDSNSTGVFIQTPGNGIELNGGQLRTRLATNSGLSATASGLAIQLATNSGLSIDSTGLSVTATSGEDYFVDNYNGTLPSIASDATDALVIGESADVGGTATDAAISIGRSASVDGSHGIALGSATHVHFPRAIAIGGGAVVGGSSASDDGESGIAIGFNADVNAEHGIAIGGHTTTGDAARVGQGAHRSIAIGYDAAIADNVVNSFVIGAGAGSGSTVSTSNVGLLAAPTVYVGSVSSENQVATMNDISGGNKTFYNHTNIFAQDNSYLVANAPNSASYSQSTSFVRFFVEDNGDDPDRVYGRAGLNWTGIKDVSINDRWMFTWTNSTAATAFRNSSTNSEIRPIGTWTMFNGSDSSTFESSAYQMGSGSVIAMGGATPRIGFIVDYDHGDLQYNSATMRLQFDFIKDG